MSPYPPDRSRWWFVGPGRIGLTILACSGMIAQNNDRGPVIRTETNVVPVDVVVTDSAGKPVMGLTREDFTIADNGKLRTIALFSAPGTADTTTATEPPLPPNVFTNKGPDRQSKAMHSTVILLDGLNGWFDNYGWSAAAVKTVAPKIPANERVALMAMSRFRGLLILQDYATDRQQLANAAKSYTPSEQRPAPPHGCGFGEGGGGSIMTSGRYSEYNLGGQRHSAEEPPPVRAYLMHNASESLRNSLDNLARVLAAVPGRKTIFWISQGFPAAELNAQAWNNTVARLNDADVEVTTISADDNCPGMPQRWGTSGLGGLEGVAKLTGGSYYHGRDIAAALAEGIRASVSDYALGFYLAPGETDGSWHDLVIHTRLRRVSLNYRQGYYARAAGPGEVKAGAVPPLEAALASPVNLTGITFTAALSQQSGPDQGNVQVRLTLGPGSVVLAHGNGVWTGNVEELFTQLSADGKPVDGTRPRFDAEGVSLTTPMKLAEGATRISVIVRDTATGNTGSLTIALSQVSFANISNPGPPK